MNYLLDTNIFIQAQDTYYCFDICPGFWDFLGMHFITGELISISHVYKELSHKDDAIYEWIQDHKPFFEGVDDEVTQRHFSAIANYVQKEYSQRKQNNPHINQFLSVADPWLIAKAKTLSATLVTHEIRGGPGSHKPKIPDICDQFNVPTIRTNDLLRSLSIRFVMENKK